MGLLKVARSRLVGAGECSPLMAEELGFEQRLGDRAAVEGDEGAVAPRARAMHRPGEHGLAGPGLALDQDGWLPAPLTQLLEQPRDLVANGRHPGAVPDQFSQRRHGWRDITAPR